MRLFLAILSRAGVAKPTIDSLTKLQFPVGTVTMHGVVSGDFVPAQREILFTQALEWGADYILALDDDIVLPPDAVLRLHEVISSDTTVGAITAIEADLVNEIGFSLMLIRASAMRSLARPYVPVEVLLDGVNGRAALRNDAGLFSTRVREAGYHVVFHPGVRCGRYNRSTQNIEPVAGASGSPPPVAGGAARIESAKNRLRADVTYVEPAPAFGIPSIAGPKRTIYLHAGVHKTGTTSLQTFITANAAALGTLGIHVPYAGRPVNYFKSPNVGHHNLAWELNGLVQFDSVDGGLSNVVDEIGKINAPTVLLTSEDFEFLHTQPEKLGRLADALNALGYTTRVILYIRAQHDYVQAIFSEHSKAGHTVSPRAYLDEIIATGAYEPMGAAGIYTGINRFSYPSLIEPFTQAFGADNVVVRAYLSGRDPSYILNEFLALVGASAIPFSSLAKPAALNVSPSFGTVLNGLYGGVKKRDPQAPTIEQLVKEHADPWRIAALNRKFDVITEAETRTLLERFRQENIEIERQFGAALPFRSDDDLRSADDPAWGIVRTQRDMLDYAIERWNVR